MPGSYPGPGMTADPSQNMQLNSLIGRLYRGTAAIQLSEFRRWALLQLHELIPFDAAFWGSGHLSTQRFHTKTTLGVDESWAEDLVNSLNINPIASVLFEEVGQPVDMADVVEDEAFFNSEIYLNHFKNYQIERILSSLHLEQRSGIFSLITLYRFDRNAKFSEQEKQWQRQLIFHLLNAASHACFLALEVERNRHKGEVRAICDELGVIHEIEPMFLDLLDAHFPARAMPGLPFKVTECAEQLLNEQLCLEVQKQGDLYRVSIWPAGPLARLTAREQEIVQAVCQGLSAKVIGKQLGVAASTVSNHLYRVYQKLGICSRAELAQLMAEM